MLPNERLIIQLTQDRQVEIQQQFKRYNSSSATTGRRRYARRARPQRSACLRCCGAYGTA